MGSPAENKFTVCIFLWESIMIPNKKKQSFLEEFREHNPDKKCAGYGEKRQSVFICFYDVKAKKILYSI